MSRLSAAGVGALVLVALSASPAAAQRGTVSIQQALDRPVNFSVADATIVEVFKKLSEATGVKFVIPDETLDCLPYGDQTRLKVNLEGFSLRKALPLMLAPQALQWFTEDEAVRIVPTEALYRMCRRASYDELKVLGVMHKEVLQTTEKGGDVLAQLRKAADDKELKIAFHPPGDKEAAFKRAERVLPCPAAQWLDMVCHGQGWTWYLAGDEIVIVDKARQIQRQLQKRVSLRYQGAKLLDVLDDLARKGRLQLEMEAGVMGLLPAETQNSLNLLMADASIAQALQMISGLTGLKFTPTADGIRVEASDALKKEPTTQPRKRPPFFVKMVIPTANGTGIEVYWTPEELPDDLVEAIQAQKADFIKRLRDAVKGAQPPTAPAKP